MDQTAASDLYLAERLREALAHDAQVAELGIDVDIRGETIVLSGVISSPEQQRAAVAMVRDLAPAYVVRDDTTVAPLTEPTDSEHLP